MSDTPRMSLIFDNLSKSDLEQADSLGEARLYMSMWLKVDKALCVSDNPSCADRADLFAWGPSSSIEVNHEDERIYVRGHAVPDWEERLAAEENTKLFAEAGEWVTCEKGHRIFQFAESIKVGQTPTRGPDGDLKELTNWRQPPPKVGEEVPGCKACGAAFSKWGSLWLHFEDGGWRGEGVPMMNDGEGTELKESGLDAKSMEYRDMVDRAREFADRSYREAFNEKTKAETVTRGSHIVKIAALDETKDLNVKEALANNDKNYIAWIDDEGFHMKETDPKDTARHTLRFGESLRIPLSSAMSDTTKTERLEKENQSLSEELTRTKADRDHYKEKCEHYEKTIKPGGEAIGRAFGNE